jgi:hypothetical protein
MANLLKETQNILEWSGKTPADVLWVGSFDGEYTITWAEFEQLANIEYDSGYGGQEIANDLVVVGNDWWLTRSEYDGSEGWHFNTKPQAGEGKSFNRVTDPEGACWASIEEMNRPGGKYADL